MPKGTRVHRCVDKVKKSGKGVNPYAVCQASTDQSYATGKKLKEGRKSMKTKEEMSREITAQRVEAGVSSKPVSDKEIADKRKRQRPIKTVTKVNSSTEYKRLGLCLAEAMGFKIDEIAFLAPIAAGAARLAAVAGRGVVAGAKAVGKAGAQGAKAVGRAGVQGAKAGGRMAKEKAINVAKDKIGNKLAGEERQDETVAVVAGRIAMGLAAKKVATTVVDKAKNRRERNREFKDQEKNAEVREEDCTGISYASGEKRADKLVNKIKKKWEKRIPIKVQEPVATPASSGKKKVQEGKIMNSYVKKLMEWKAGPIAKRIAKHSPAGEEGRMSKTKGKRISRDPVVHRETKKTQKNVDKKLGVKTNLKVKDAVQGSLNRRRARVKKGKSVEGSPPIAPSTKKDSAADAARDKWRRMAPGDK